MMPVRQGPIKKRPSEKKILQRRNDEDRRDAADGVKEMTIEDLEPLEDGAERPRSSRSSSRHQMVNGDPETAIAPEERDDEVRSFGSRRGSTSSVATTSVRSGGSGRRRRDTLKLPSRMRRMSRRRLSNDEEDGVVTTHRATNRRPAASGAVWKPWRRGAEMG